VHYFLPEPTPEDESKWGRKPIDEALIKPEFKPLVDRIKASVFHSEHQLEPTIGSKEGIALLDGITILDADMSRVCQHGKTSGKSIYWLLVDHKTKVCRICGIRRGTEQRAIGCVRTDLGHRPFRCPGIDANCYRCGPYPYVYVHLFQHLF
jgi:hypothetical protein